MSFFVAACRLHTFAEPVRAIMSLVPPTLVRTSLSWRRTVLRLSITHSASPWQCSASSLFVATEGAIVVYNLFVSSQARRETLVIRRGANASREQEQKLDDGRERTSWREFIHFRGLTNSVRDVLECFVLVSYSVFSNIIPNSLYIPDARKVHHELLPSRKTLDDTIIRVEGRLPGHALRACRAKNWKWVTRKRAKKHIGPSTEKSFFVIPESWIRSFESHASFPSRRCHRSRPVFMTSILSFSAHSSRSFLPLIFTHRPPAWSLTSSR